MLKMRHDNDYATKCILVHVVEYSAVFATHDKDSISFYFILLVEWF